MSREMQATTERPLSPIPGRAKALVATVLLLDGLLAVPAVEGWRIGQLPHGVLLFLLPFNLFALGWILEMLSRWILERPLEPEGLQFGSSGDLEWAEFRRLGPIKFSLGVLFAISFVLMFFAFRVPSEGLARAWPMLLILGTALWIGKAAFNLRRARRFVYRPVDDMLYLPGGEQIPGGSFALRVEEMRSPRGDKVRSRPVFTLREAGRVRDLKLPWTSGRNQSDQFCDWLAARGARRTE